MWNNIETTQVLVDETEFWVSITDPCIRSNSIVTPVISGIVYEINGHPAAETSTVGFLHDWASD